MEQIKLYITELYRDNLDIIDSLNEFDKNDFINICKNNFDISKLINSLKFLSK